MCMVCYNTPGKESRKSHFKQVYPSAYTAETSQPPSKELLPAKKLTYPRKKRRPSLLAPILSQNSSFAHTGANGTIYMYKAPIGYILFPPPFLSPFCSLGFSSLSLSLFL